MCSLLYQYRYKDDLKKEEYLHPRVRNQIRFEETIKKVVSFFFFKKQAYSEPSYQALLNRWQRLWFGKDRTIGDLVTLQNEVMWDSQTSFTTQAALALMDFYSDFSDKIDLQVLLCNEDFSVPLDRDITLDGNFDLVLRERVNGRSIYHIYKWSGFHKRPASGFWDFDFAALDYAFRYRNDFKPLDVRYYIWDFGSSKPGVVEFTVSDEMINFMKFWAESLHETEVFVPRRGLTSHCRQCYFDEPCSKWEFPKEQAVEISAKR